MRALVWHGKKDVRCGTVPDPYIEEPRDAIVKVTSCAIREVLFLGDTLPTGWQAALQCDIQPTDTVAVWGAGPVGQMTIRSVILLGAAR